MLDLDLLNYFTQPLNSVDESLIKNTLFALSNIAVDSEKAAEAILNHEALIWRILTLMTNSLESLRKEATYALTYAIMTSSEGCLREFHKSYMREYIKPLLICLDYFQKNTDSKFVLEMLLTVKRLLEMDSKNPIYDTRLGPGYGSFRSYFTELGGEEIIERV